MTENEPAPEHEDVSDPEALAVWDKLFAPWDVAIRLTPKEGPAVVRRLFYDDGLPLTGVTLVELNALADTPECTAIYRPLIREMIDELEPRGLDASSLKIEVVALSDKLEAESADPPVLFDIDNRDR